MDSHDPTVTTFYLLALEADRYQTALADYAAADKVTGQLQALTRALDSAFACLELVGSLRVHDPAWAAEVCAIWRELVLKARDAESGLLKWSAL